MTVLSALCFAVCLVLVVSALRTRGDVFSPGRVFGFIWCLAIGLADLKLSRLQHAWTPESWVVVLLGPACFLAGRFAIWTLHLGVPLRSIRTISDGWRSCRVDEPRLFAAGVILFVLFVLGFSAIVASGREVPLFSARPGKARLAFQLFGLGLFLHNAVLIALIALVYWLQVRVRTARHWILVALSLAAQALYGLTLQRFQIVMTAILCLVLLYYTTRHLRPATLTVYAGLATVFFLAVSTLRSGQLFIAYLYLDSQMTFDPRFAVLTEPYMYFAMNLENFARAGERLQEFSYGIFTLDPVAALSGLKHWLRGYLGVQETPFLISGYNTYSLFWTYYRDFGLPGLAGLSWWLGVSVGMLYHRMRMTPAITSVIWYTWAVFVMLFSFYLNPLTFLWFTYNLVVLAVVLRLCIPRPAVQPLLRGGSS